MHASRPASDGPQTEQEFQRNLTWLIRTARDNGVSVAGGWMDRTQDSHRPDWGVEIYQVAKRDSGADEQSQDR